MPNFDKEMLETRRDRYFADLQKAEKEVQGWSRRAAQLEGCIAGLNALLAELESEPVKEPEPA